MAFRLLIINPNTSTSMTDALRPVVARALGASADVTCDFYTAPPPAPDAAAHPGALASINSPEDSTQSAEYVYPLVAPLAVQYDACLVACYSAHPLVGMLARASKPRPRYVTGIFEASVAASLSLLAQLPPGSTFGIVSTGRVWEDALSDATGAFLGAASSARFAGCRTTGMSALELHDAPPEVVRERMADAAARLLGDAPKTRVVCLGCAAMSGGADAIRDGAARVLGEGAGGDVHVVDGVAAGVAWLVGACRSQF